MDEPYDDFFFKNRIENIRKGLGAAMDWQHGVRTWRLVHPLKNCRVLSMHVEFMHAVMAFSFLAVLAIVGQIIKWPRS